MNDEIEATFENVNKTEIRAKLQSLKATLVKPEFMQKRVVFNIPAMNISMAYMPVVSENSITFMQEGIQKTLHINNSNKAQDLLNMIYSPEIRQAKNKGWLRVRNEGDKITMTYKRQDSSQIDGMREIEIVIDDFDTGFDLLASIGCEYKAYQETKRELWELNGVEITIDEWPYLEPFVEVEGESADEVRHVSDMLEFNWDNAVFGAADTLYARKYGITEHQINNETPRILFDEPNPFLK